MIEISIQKKLRTARGAMQLNAGVSFPTGELVGLYGQSGAGKTSLLRMLAGLMEPDGGTIRFEGRVWYDSAERKNVPVRDRRIGFVFQDYALFPNMNVRQNIVYGIRQPADRFLADQLLELTDLAGFAASPVRALSGGQQQRVALARAIASGPSLLLLDEPLSAIDNALRLQLQEMLLEMHRRFKLTTLLISHNAEELVRLTDRMLHLHDGMIETYSDPGAYFYGKSQGLTGRVVQIDEQQIATILVREQRLRIDATGSGLKAGEDATVFYQAGEPVVRKL